jgi:hypothetical protein
MVPEYPVYWIVPTEASAGVHRLVADGQVEYEPVIARHEGGQFAPALQLQTVQVAAPSPAAKPFGRKAPRA